jgi:Rhodopirellula transposase DDE domain
MAVSGDAVAVLAAKFAVMRKVADERTWRVYLGSEALALGHGGIKAVALAAQVSETTVAAGIAEIGSGGLEDLPPGRSRRPGGGRKKAEDTQPGLRDALRGLLEEATRGDPVAEITWCSLSLREIARRLALLGFGCGKDAIARIMRGDGYSLQGMAKVLEGRQHPDRDAQFRRINAEIDESGAAGEPVVSVDGKKKERLGLFARDGRTWRPEGDPVKVRDHDFPERETVTISPYGVYDIAANRGFVSVGTSHDTAAFAVNAVRLWWRKEGSLRYPGARRLLVICDAGGSSSYTGKLWKHELALLRDETGLEITVMHFPPGTSKWNKIEHRLFCHITRTWRARPLMTVQDAVAGIAATITSQGLKCTAFHDTAGYPTGTKVSDARMKHLNDCDLDRDPFHGEWNYTLRAVPRPAPRPEPARERPGRVPQDTLNQPALTGMEPGDVTALAAALEIPYRARLEHKAYLQRGGPRASAVRSSGPHGNRRLDVTGHVLAVRLRDHLSLPMDAIGALLGVDRSTAGHAITLTRTLITENAIPLPVPALPPAITPRTPAELREHAAAAGITLTIPENGQTMPEHFRSRRREPRHART